MKSLRNLQKILTDMGGITMDLHITDPEFMERLDRFMLEEVINEPGQQLPDKTRYMAVLATLIGCQGVDEFKIVLNEALESRCV